MSQTNAFAGAFYQTGNISQYEGIAVSAFYHAQIGSQCGKVIVCDFRVRVCYHGQQCRFANIRETNQTNVCDKFQFQNDVIFFCHSAGFRITGCLSGGCCEVLIALAAFTAVNQDFFFPVFGNIRHNLAAFRFTDNSTNRHFDDNAFAVFTEAVAFAAVLTVACLEHSLITEVHKGTHAFVPYKNHVAASAAVTAIRAAVGNIFRTEERNHTIAAVAAFYMNLDSIYKHILTSYPFSFFQNLFRQKQTVLLFTKKASNDII